MKVWVERIVREDIGFEFWIMRMLNGFVSFIYYYFVMLVMWFYYVLKKCIYWRCKVVCIYKDENDVSVFFFI